MPIKKPRLASDAPPLTGLAALPPALVEGVMAFLVGDDFYRDSSYRHGTRQLAPLPTLAQVSSQWRDVVDESASTRVLTTLRFGYKDEATPATRTEMLEMRRVLILRRVYLQRLILLNVPDFGSESSGIWQAALSHTPRLRSLDMDELQLVRPPSRDILDVTRAAARQCPLLQKLVFPPKMSRAKTRKEPRAGKTHMRVFVEGLLACLPAWTKHGGGLRHLRLAMREYDHGRAFMPTFFDAITTYCPQIELLDGFASTVETVNIITCQERWYLGLATWERFCATCSQLTLIDWVTLPFATQFFEIFGRYSKPKLTSLTFSVSAMWKWRRYLATVDPTTKATLEATGYGAAAVNAHAVLAACPNLKKVRVEWFLRPGLLNFRDMDPKIFGDDFFEALARHCSGLTRLHHGPVPTEALIWSRPSVSTLTDRSFRALATLPDLTWVEMVTPSITGDGLFELVINHATTTRHERVYFFVLGDDTADRVSNLRFYEVVKDFLERLLAYDGELPCASRPVIVQLKNADLSELDEGYSVAFFSSVLLTVGKLQQKYPTLQLSGLVRDHNKERGLIKRMIDFAMATASSQLPDWTEDSEEVEAEDSEIEGDVFVNRRYYGSDLDYPDQPGDDEEYAPLGPEMDVDEIVLDDPHPSDLSDDDGEDSSEYDEISSNDEVDESDDE